MLPPKSAAVMVAAAVCGLLPGALVWAVWEADKSSLEVEDERLRACARRPRE